MHVSIRKKNWILSGEWCVHNVLRWLWTCVCFLCLCLTDIDLIYTHCLWSRFGNTATQSLTCLQQHWQNNLESFISFLIYLRIWWKHQCLARILNISSYEYWFELSLHFQWCRRCGQSTWWLWLWWLSLTRWISTRWRTRQLSFQPERTKS